MKKTKEKLYQFGSGEPNFGGWVEWEYSFYSKREIFKLYFRSFKNKWNFRRQYCMFALTHLKQPNTKEKLNFI